MSALIGGDSRPCTVQTVNDETCEKISVESITQSAWCVREGTCGIKLENCEGGWASLCADDR